MMCARCVSAVRTEMLQRFRDLLVRVPQGEQAKHLALALRERILLGAASLVRLGLDEPRPERGMDVALACGDGTTASTSSVSAASLST